MKDGKLSFIEQKAERTKVMDYKVWLDSENIYVQNEVGEVASKPIARYKRLLNATPEQREKFELSSCGVHWFDLDIDLAFDSFFNPDKYNLLAHESLTSPNVAEDIEMYKKK